MENTHSQKHGEKNIVVHDEIIWHMENQIEGFLWEDD
jgi:hypothetical protein